MKKTNVGVVRAWGIAMGLVAVFLSGCGTSDRVEQGAESRMESRVTARRETRSVPSVRPPRQMSPAALPHSLPPAPAELDESVMPDAEVDGAGVDLSDAPSPDAVREWASAIARGEEPEGFDQFDFNACAGRLLAMVVTGEESDKVASLQVLQALCHSEGQDGSEDQYGEDGSEGGDDEDGDGDVDETFVVTTMVQTGLRDASPVVRAAALEALSTLPTTEREMVSLVALGGDDVELKKAVLAQDEGLLDKYAAIWMDDDAMGEDPAGSEGVDP